MSERTYANDQVEVSWNAQLCIHTGLCIRSAPQVFDLQARPWVNVDGASADEVIVAVGKCPTGALKVRRVDEDAPAEALPDTPEIRLLTNGPVIVRGNVTIKKGAETIEACRVALCRCGDSGNKPFCDNSHRTNGFSTEGESAAAARADRPPPEQRQSPADCG